MINGGAFISAWTPRCLCRCCLPEFSTGSCMINGDLKKVPRSKVTRCMEYTCGCGERRGWEAAIVCGRICLSAPARVKPCSVSRLLTASSQLSCFAKINSHYLLNFLAQVLLFHFSSAVNLSNGTFRSHCRHMSCRVAFSWSPDCGIPQEENKQSGWLPLAAQDKASKTSHSVVVIGLNDNRTRLIDSFYK